MHWHGHPLFCPSDGHTVTNFEQWVSWGKGERLVCSLKDSPSFSRVGCDWQFIWAGLRGFAVWIITNCGKFLKKWECQTTWPASWEICTQVKKQQLELDMEQRIGSKLGKEYIKTIYCHPAYLIYMQSTSWEMLDWIKQSCNQDCQEKYQ